jgi:hypothetical protein
MTSLGPPEGPHHGQFPYYPPPPFERQPPPRRGRVSAADVIATVTLWATAGIAAAISLYLSLFFGFAADGCSGSCPPVPLNLDEWIYPVTWGGIVVAFAVGFVGTCIALWRGWYMWVWPTAALAIVVLAFVAGAAMTEFSQSYW